MSIGSKQLLMISKNDDQKEIGNRRGEFEFPVRQLPSFSYEYPLERHVYIIIYFPRLSVK